LVDPNGTPFLDDQGQAEQFVGHLSATDLAELEVIQVDDLPAISMTVERDGKPAPIRFGNLSFGQKSSILLSFTLFSEARRPLIIDQPEDHLDSQFIYETVVKTLRQIKERRQIIVATHNANIAVLGDAELLLPLISWKGIGRITDRGSVVNPATRARVQDPRGR
jgi:predicted ATPase